MDGRIYQWGLDVQEMEMVARVWTHLERSGATYRGGVHAASAILMVSFLVRLLSCTLIDWVLMLALKIDADMVAFVSEHCVPC